MNLNPPKTILSFISTSLAGVLVAPLRQPSLGFPIGAVVRNRPAEPHMMILTPLVNTHPLGVAGSATEKPLPLISSPPPVAEPKGFFTQTASDFCLSLLASLTGPPRRFALMAAKLVGIFGAAIRTPQLLATHFAGGYKPTALHFFRTGPTARVPLSLAEPSLRYLGWLPAVCTWEAHRAIAEVIWPFIPSVKTCRATECGTLLSDLSRTFVDWGLTLRARHDWHAPNIAVAIT